MNDLTYEQIEIELTKARMWREIVNIYYEITMDEIKHCIGNKIRDRIISKNLFGPEIRQENNDELVQNMIDEIYNDKPTESGARLQKKTMLTGKNGEIYTITVERGDTLNSAYNPAVRRSNEGLFINEN